MLIRHTLLYLPAQLLSPLAQLASMVLWTHWLAPGEMGVFTLISVAQEITYLLCLNWFSVYALRYLPSPDDVAARCSYLDTENAVVLVSTGATLLCATVAVLALPAHVLDVRQIGLVWAFFATKTLNTHYAERARAQSAFLSYSILQTAGPVGGLALGWLAVQWSPASAGQLLGVYAIAQALGVVLAVPGLGLRWRLPRPDLGLLRASVDFGAPMLLLAALGWAGENYIRYLVQWVAGEKALGLMVVGWALGRRCASVAAMLVTTAAFPIAARLLNAGERAQALDQLQKNALLLIAVLVPVTVGVAMLGPQLMTFVIASEYRDITAELLGISVLAGAIRNLHLHVTDQLMVLDRRVRMLSGVDLFEIAVCGAASWVGLTGFGVHGAVIGQAVGSLLALGLSIHLAGSRLGFAWPWVGTARVLVACSVMASVIAITPTQVDTWGLVLKVLAGTAAYLVAAGALAANW